MIFQSPPLPPQKPSFNPTQCKDALCEEPNKGMFLTTGLSEKIIRFSCSNELFSVTKNAKNVHMIQLLNFRSIYYVCSFIMPTTVVSMQRFISASVVIYQYMFFSILIPKSEKIEPDGNFTHTMGWRIFTRSRCNTGSQGPNCQVKRGDVVPELMDPLGCVV